MTRTIEAGVEVAYGRARGRVDDRIRAIGAKTRGIAGAGRDELEIVLDPPDREIVAGAGFRLDDAAFPVDRLVGNGQFAGRFAHQHQRGVDQIGVGPGQVQLVDRIFEPGRGIGVRAEGKAKPFEQLDHLAFGHIGRPVEGHVFEHVGKTEFLLAFIDPAHVEAEPDDGGTLRRTVPEDRIAHAVFEHAEADAIS